MKYINIIAALLISLLWWSCDEDQNMDPVGNWTLTPAEAVAPAVGQNITLDATSPDTPLTFEWLAAESSAGYEIRYNVELATLTDSLELITVESDNVGKATTASITYAQLDELLAQKGYDANETISIIWTVITDCVGKIERTETDIELTRFDVEWIPSQLFLSGTASEMGDDIEQSIQMKRLIDDGGIYEVYTHLETSGTFKFYSDQSESALMYGGENGAIEKLGSEISVAEAGEYRVTVDLNNNTYQLTKINFWGAIGGAFSGGWGADEVLEYQGAGIWQAEIDFVNEEGYIFRANGEWSELLKQVSGSENELVLESFGNEQGIGFNDLSAQSTGLKLVAIDLSANGYTFTITDVANENEPVATPDALFLLDGDGLKIADFSKDGDTFVSTQYIALQASMDYSLNSKEDGTGTSYTTDILLGVSENPAGDYVNGKITISENEGALQVEVDQAYSLSIDFSNGELSWHYYNLKIFHWDNANDGWDDRSEIAMTYVHPYTFTTEATLSNDFDTKFNSPWAVEFGAKQGTDDIEALSGTATNKALQEDTETYPNENFKFPGGTYSITFVISEDYKTANYTLGE